MSQVSSLRRFTLGLLAAVASAAASAPLIAAHPVAAFLEPIGAILFPARAQLRAGIGPRVRVRRSGARMVCMRMAGVRHRSPGLRHLGHIFAIDPAFGVGGMARAGMIVPVLRQSRRSKAHGKRAGGEHGHEVAKTHGNPLVSAGRIPQLT